MKNKLPLSRRGIVKGSILGLITAAVPGVGYSQIQKGLSTPSADPTKLFHRYPSIDDEIVAEVVGASHFDFDKVKKLVNERPELARATWDWGFGDWESAIGAASHVGRKDIVEFLISKGARPNQFTYAMLGAYEIVKSMIEFSPGLQRVGGPHGISLLRHAKIGLNRKAGDPEQTQKLIDYLEELGDADSPEYMEMPEADKEKYVGDYLYGEGPTEGFTIRLTRRKTLSLGKLGKSGGGLLQFAENKFRYNGTSSVEISFSIVNDKVESLTVNEPGLTLVARKV